MLDEPVSLPDHCHRRPKLTNDSRFTVAGREIISGAQSYYPAILLLFSEADRHELTPESHDGWGVYYETSVEVARDRLDVLGYSPARARRAFEIGRVELQRRLAEVRDEYEDDEETALLLEADEYFARESSYERWQGEMHEHLVSDPANPTALPGDPTVFEHLGDSSRFAIAGFPGHDVLACLRGLLDVCFPSDRVRYDLSGLVGRGFIDSDDLLADNAKLGVGAAYLPSQKIIVLTEGVFDSRVLSRSLQLLSPHLSSYFSFLDFEAMKVPGGAGTVIGFVKAFVGAGVANRVIAILDNDSAARDAARALASIHLPERVRVIQHPALELLRDYPTLGPTGPTRMDVNGLAGGIELYLGEDILRDDNGDLFPIQWRGYIDGVRAYQGDLLKKQEVQRRFERKLQVCEQNHQLIATQDWSGVRAILAALRTEFAVDS